MSTTLTKSILRRIVNMVVEEESYTKKVYKKELNRLCCTMYDIRNTVIVL